jgi:hypothetical protein
MRRKLVARGDTFYGDAKGCLGSLVALVVILGVIGLLYEYWYITVPVSACSSACGTVGLGATFVARRTTG